MMKGNKKNASQTQGETDMLLSNKVAVIYGAGGDIGGAVARAFVSDGPRSF
jgi:hypothetical protein